MKRIIASVVTSVVLGLGAVAQAQDGCGGGGCCGGEAGAKPEGKAEDGGCCAPETAGAALPASTLGPLDALVGEWEADTNADGQPDVVVTYRKTAGGTAMVETIMPGTPKEMVTVYHRDGQGFALTHYCLGNQPRMRGAAAEGRIVFDFVDGTNMQPTDAHMHSLTLTFVDGTHLRHEWTMWKDGKAANKVVFELTRRQVG